jgi:flagellar motor switch protein FliG
MESVDGVVLERMADVLRERIRTGGTTVTEELDGRAALAEILRRMAPGSEEEILSELPAEVSEAIRERLFTVDSLLQIRDQDLQEILRDYGDHDIALVLKGKAEPIRAKILRNVSERRRTLIAEEYAHLGPRPQREIASVTRDFLAHLRRLEEQGRLLVRDRGDEYI